MVDCNIVQSAERQQHSYRGTRSPQLKQGQKVLLNNPTKGKLDPRWTGPWMVKQYNNSTTVRLTKDNKEQVVHISRVRPLLEEDNESMVAEWSPPLFHEVPLQFTDPPAQQAIQVRTLVNSCQQLEVAVLLGL